MVALPVAAVVTKDITRPIRGAGYWTNRDIAESSVLEEVRTKSLQKMNKVLKRSTRRMRKLRKDPSRYEKISSLWSELISLEKSRQHYVDEEIHLRDGRDDGGPMLAEQMDAAAWNEWTWYIGVCTNAWTQAVRQERRLRIRLLDKQLRLIRTGLLWHPSADGFTTWADEQVTKLEQDIKGNFDNLDYCPEDKIVELTELAMLPVWLVTSYNMWNMEGVYYSKL